MAQVVEYDAVRFRTPFGALCFGPTGSGKTVYIKQLLRSRNQCFNKPPQRVVYVYSMWQILYDEMLEDDPTIEFTRKLDDVIGNDDYFDKTKVNLLILDDLADVVANSKEASNLFTRGVHHKNISVIHICQNMFQQGKVMRTIQLNAQYLILFKNVRDRNQIKVLGQQAHLPYLSDAYEKVTSEPYQPLILDFRGDCPDAYRMKSHLLPGQIPRVYMNPKDIPEECRRK